MIEPPGIFRGPVLPSLIRLSLPLAGGLFFYLLYNVVDTIWLSRIDLMDPSYVGGAGLIFPIVAIAIALYNGLITGTGSFVARGIGMGDGTVVRKALKSGLLLGSVISILFMIITYAFGREFISLLGAEGDYLTHALDYLYYVIPAAVGMFGAGVFSGLFQGEGKMKFVMISLIIGTGGNVILDPVFIFLLDLKVKGAAMATSLSQLMALFYLVVVFVKKKAGTTKKIHTDFSVTWDILKIGLPQAAGQIIFGISVFISNMIVISLDPEALTAFTICSRVDQIVYIPIFAVGSALITMVGQNYGRKNYKRLPGIIKTAFILTGSVVFVLTALLILLAPFIVPLFSRVEKVINYAVWQLRIIEISALFAVFPLVGRSLFQGTGRAMPAFILTVSRMLLFILPLTFLLVYVFKLEMYGVWFGYTAGNALCGLLGFLWIRRDLQQLSNKMNEFPL